MKNNFRIIILCIVLLCSGLTVVGKSVEGDADFYVMGYFSEGPFDDPIDEVIDFDNLTHVIYAFVKPQADGQLYPIQKPDRLRELVEKCHQRGVKVIISVGGVFYQNQPLVPKFEAFSSTQEGIDTFVREISAFVDEYQLDGIEIDWEYPSPSTMQQYENLMTALRAAMDLKGKTVSAAVAGAGSVDTKATSVTSISDKALESMDWINVMVYDLQSGHHSPFWYASVSIDYWLKRGVEADKIILGLPLYARPSWRQYRYIVADDRNNAYIDFIKGDKLDSYYNGINTIMQKTRLALKSAGGIMFFDIHEDTHDETSALGAAVRMIGRRANPRDLLLIVDNRELEFKLEDGLGIPYIDNHNRTMVPVRKILETIGANINYDHLNGIVTATKEEDEVKIFIGYDYIEHNGQRIQMDTKAVVNLSDGRTYLPIKWVLSCFNYDVVWQGRSASIIMNKK